MNFLTSFLGRRWRAASLGRLPWLIGAIGLFLGVSRAMDHWSICWPIGLQGLHGAASESLSIVSAMALWPLIPKMLRTASVERLQSLIGELEAEVRQRRSNEEQLVQHQDNLSVTLASISAGFIATDREGQVTSMNAVAERLTGWVQADARGRPVGEVLQRHESSLSDLSRNPVDAMIERGITIDVVDRFIVLSRDGVRAPVELQAGLTRANDGTVLGMAMVIRDRTGVIRAEAEPSRLAAIVESSSDAIVGKTLDGRITDWNAGAEALFGYSAGEAIGQSVTMLIPPERAEEELRIVANISSGGRVPRFDTVRLAKNGRRIDVSVTVSPIRDGEGRIVGAAKIARDVTSERRAEAALRDSETRLRFTLESAAIGDWDMDLATGVMQRSLRHDRCFGYDEMQPEWTFDTFIEHVHPDERSEVAHSLHVALTSAQPWHVQCRVIWPDGSVHWISAHGKVQLQEGHAGRMLGIVTEITQQRLAEDVRLTAQRLEVENRQIQAANRLKSQFLANMSHELRTPLNAVIGFADLLQSGTVPPGSPKHAKFLGHISTSGRHLLQLINDVLDLSKVESGKFEFFPEPVQLPALLKEVSDVLQATTQRKQIEIDVQVEPGLTDLVLDMARLKQVLYNYLSNAIKFTPQGGRVTVRAMAHGASHFRIEVEDTGIGISPTDLSRLFVEFQQLDAGYSKQHQGTGLGLALTRRLVEAQGGSVGVRSTVGVGSVFHVLLNRVHGTDAQGASLGKAAARNRMLLIEEHGPASALALQSLSEIGFDVDCAATGEQALSKAGTTVYDAMTLSLQLADRTGLGVLEGIRQDGASRYSPVVGMSMPAQGGTAASFSIADVLSKPIRGDEILAAMTRFRQGKPGGARVLVIDDDALALDLMQAALHHVNIEAVCFLDGREALRDIHRHQPDAIILDLMMPGFNGFEVLHALHEMPQWRDVPVFVWTSMILTEAEYADLSGSAQAILSKGGGALAAMLESMCRKYAAALEVAEGLRT